MNFGCMDLCGFPKSAFYMHQAHWIEDRPILRLVPHWNWPGREGKPIKVLAITNADTVSLSLNGKVIGENRVDKFDFTSWDVPYEPGTLEAVAKKDSKEVARFAVETTGEAVASANEMSFTSTKRSNALASRRLMGLRSSGPQEYPQTAKRSRSCFSISSAISQAVA